MNQLNENVGKNDIINTDELNTAEDGQNICVTNNKYNISSL